MCGIAGFFSQENIITNQELEKMTLALSHRGPDASGSFREGNAGLGHNRLSIIDLSAMAHQPMRSDNNNFVISYNGEVYNHRDLVPQLPIQLRTHCDTEVIVEAFAKWRTKCFKMFNGMFAIAIYDRELKKLYLCRDRMGIKPLFYYYDEKNFIFASEIKALLQVNIIKKAVSINKQALNDYLYLGYIPEPHTIYSNIYKFPAGAIATVGEKEFMLEKYWVLEEQLEPKPLQNPEKVRIQLKKLVKSSVEYRLMSDVPFGTLLSGGVDSSLVTAIAQEIRDDRINTFSIAFKESQFDESLYARQVADHLKTRHYEFTVSNSDALSMVDEMVKAFDEPFADSSAIPTMLVSKLARRHVKMTLSGDGGDETHFGYGFYNWASRLSNPAIRTARYPISWMLSVLNNRSRRAAYMFKYPDIAKIKSHIFSQEQYFFTEGELRRLVQEEYREKINLDEDVSSNTRKLTEKEKQAIFDLKYFLKDDLLVKVDRASMHYSLENRVPLLDHRLVRLALNISPGLRLNNGIPKYLLKELLYEYLPPKLFDRPKWGFGMPVNLWLKNEWRYLIDEYLSEQVINSCGLVNYAVVKKLKKAYIDYKRDYLYNRLWALILLHKWHIEHYQKLKT